MVIISRLEEKPFNLLQFYCQVYYIKDDDSTIKMRHDFDNENGNYLLLDGYYIFNVHFSNKIIDPITNKEIYFSDLVKI